MADTRALEPATTPPAAQHQPDPRLWPVTTTMAAGIFATTFVQFQALGYMPFNHLLKAMGMDSNKAANFFSLTMLPWTFKVVAGLLVDGVPLFGSRRRAYLLMSAASAAVIWLLMGCWPGNYPLLFALGISMNIAVVFGSTTSGGLLVEAGQRFGASGRLSSVRVGAQNLGAALGTLVGGLLAARALAWTSAAAILPLACMFLAAWLLLKEPRLPPRASHDRSSLQQASYILRSIWRQIRNVTRREMLLPALLLFFLQAVPTFRSTSFYQYQTGPLQYSDAALGWLGLIGYGAALLSSAVYAWCCRKVSLRTSLHASIILVSLSALPYLYYQAYTPYMLRASAIEGSGYILLYLAYLPLFDLAVRCTPKGSEALGYSLLISVWNVGLMIGSKLGPMFYEQELHKNMNSLIWLNAGVTLGGLLLVALMPKTLVAQREGHDS